MPATEIKPGIYWIGVNDRSTDLFEGIWPIDGTGISYNSYLIVDEKKVLVDLAKSAQEGAFLDQLSDVLAPDQLDYIVINHMEPDHTGVIKVLKQLAPQATILGSAKTVGMLDNFFGITEGVRAVADGEELVLGEKTIDPPVPPQGAGPGRHAEIRRPGLCDRGGRGHQPPDHTGRPGGRRGADQCSYCCNRLTLRAGGI